MTSLATPTYSRSSKLHTCQAMGLTSRYNTAR
jgi:hypothetical protein